MTTWGLLAAVLLVGPAGAQEDEARKKFLVGATMADAGEAAAAVPWFEDVLELDPSFCRAHYYLAFCYLRIGGGESEAAAIEQARAFRGCASEEEAGDLEKLRKLVPGAFDETTASEDATTDVERGSLLAELEMLREAQTQREEEERARQRTLVEARQDLKSDAAAVWQAVVEIAEGGGPEGELALRKFIEAYDGLTVEVDGTEYPVDVSEIDAAKAWLERYHVGSAPQSETEPAPTPVEPVEQGDGSTEEADVSPGPSREDGPEALDPAPQSPEDQTAHDQPADEVEVAVAGEGNSQADVDPSPQSEDPPETRIDQNLDRTEGVSVKVMARRGVGVGVMLAGLGMAAGGFGWMGHYFRFAEDRGDSAFDQGMRGLPVGIVGAAVAIVGTIVVALPAKTATATVEGSGTNIRVTIQF